MRYTVKGIAYDLLTPQSHHRGRVPRGERVAPSPRAAPLARALVTESDAPPPSLVTSPFGGTDAPGGPWVEVARLPYRYAGSALELAVPRNLLGLKGDAFTFDFKWAGNPSDLKDPIPLCTTGDVAPSRRLNYRCIWCIWRIWRIWRR